MIEARVRDVIASVFALAQDDLPARLGPDSVSGWTSLRQVQLALALEREFDIEIDPNAIPDLVSERAIVDFVTEVAA
jgi:acyl carrier protein